MKGQKKGIFLAPLSDNDLNDLFWINQNVIDCDIHNEVPNIEVLKPYLSIGGPISRNQLSVGQTQMIIQKGPQLQWL